LPPRPGGVRRYGSGAGKVLRRSDGHGRRSGSAHKSHVAAQKSGRGRPEDRRRHQDRRRSLRVSRVKRLIILLILALACAKREAPKQAVAPAEEEFPTDAAERLSILDLAHGATVVSRTGEALLELSALRAVDGDPGSFWMSPLHDLPQSMVIALPARDRIGKVGIRTVGKGGVTANHVAFEASNDGRTFVPITTIKSAVTGNAQWFDVNPTEAAYVRVTMVDSPLPEHDVRLCSVLAGGVEIHALQPGDITGCWTINGEPARFARHGAHVIGTLKREKEPIRFAGGFQ